MKATMKPIAAAITFDQSIPSGAALRVVREMQEGVVTPDAIEAAIAAGRPTALPLPAAATVSPGEQT